MANTRIRVVILLALLAYVRMNAVEREYRTHKILAGIELEPKYQIMVDAISKLVLNDAVALQKTILIKYNGTTLRSSDRLATTVGLLMRSIEGVQLHVAGVEIQDRRYYLDLRICFVDSVDAVLNLAAENVFKSVESGRVSTLIVFMTQVEDMGQNLVTMENIFQTLSYYFLINSNIAMPFGEKEIRFYTYMPYTAGDCHSTRPIHIHTYVDGSMTDKGIFDLYLNKVHNLNGCPLRVATQNLPPYVTIHPGKKGLDILSGFEGEILKEIAVKLNFTLEITENLNYNYVTRNGTTSGVYKLLDEHKANVSIGDQTCFPNRMKVLTASFSFYQSNIHIIVRASQSYSSIEVLFYPYERDIWCTLVIMFSARFLLAMFVGNFVRKLPPTFKRIIMAMWLISMFYFRIGYESFYFTFMQNRPLKPLPELMDDMRQKGYHLISDLSTKSLFQYYTELGDIVVSNQLSPDKNYEMLLRSSDKIGIATKEGYLTYYLDSHREIREHLFRMHEYIMNNLKCFYFPRSSYMAKTFNEVILNLRQFGMIQKFANDFININALPLRTNQLQPKSLYTKLNALSLYDLVGVFAMLMAMWFIGLIVLVLELLSLRYGILRRFFELF